MDKRITETRTVEVEEDEDDLRPLGATERAEIKQAFKAAADKLKDISARAQTVKESGLEPEMYSNLAEEVHAVACGLRRLAFKGEVLTRDDDSGPVYVGPSRY